MSWCCQALHLLRVAAGGSRLQPRGTMGFHLFVCFALRLPFDAVLGRSYCPLTLHFWRRDTSAPHAPRLDRSPLPSRRNMQLPDSAKEAFTTSCVTAVVVGKGDDVKRGCRSNPTSGCVRPLQECGYGAALTGSHSWSPWTSWVRST